jgi:hypothetical protein
MSMPDVFESMHRKLAANRAVIATHQQAFDVMRAGHQRAADVRAALQAPAAPVIETLAQAVESAAPVIDEPAPSTIARAKGGASTAAVTLQQERAQAVERAEPGPMALADAYVNRTGPFTDPVDTAPVGAVEAVAAPIDEPPKVAATECAMFTSPEYLADLEALKARMAARAEAQKDEPLVVTTYRELTDDERRRRLLHVMEVARELPAWRNDEPCGHTPLTLDHRVIELLANDPKIGEWTRAEYQRTGPLAEILDLPRRLTYFLFHVTDILCARQDDRYVLLDRIATVLSAIERGEVPHSRATIDPKHPVAAHLSKGGDYLPWFKF